MSKWFTVVSSWDFCIQNMLDADNNVIYRCVDRSKQLFTYISNDDYIVNIQNNYSKYNWQPL